jgi:hypothetical protein
MKHVVRLAAFALLPILAACHSSDGDHAMTLKMYEAPPAQINDLVRSLATALGTKASVSKAGPGKLLVYAPADAQASIGSAIAELRNSAPPQSAPRQVELHLWIIDAIAGNSPDDPALHELAPSLASLRQTMGPTSFHLAQTLSSASTAGAGSELTLEDHGTVQQFLFTTSPIQYNDALSIEVNYQVQGNAADAGPKLVHLNANLDTRLGQYTVLAKAPSSCPAASVAASTPCEKSWRLLVVRVDGANSSH